MPSDARGTEPLDATIKREAAVMRFAQRNRQMPSQELVEIAILCTAGPTRRIKRIDPPIMPVHTVATR